METVPLFTRKQLSNQAQASIDGDNSLSAEQTWSSHQPRRHRVTPPSMIRAPITPPPASSFEYYTRMRSSPPLNPWNPYLRSYGRVYPYNVAVNQYENAPQNYVVMRENSPQQVTPANYAAHVHLVAPPPPPPQPTYREFRMRQTLLRPIRSNRSSFHHYRHGVQDAEISSGYSSLPVELIEISSDEEDNGDNARPGHHTPSFSRRHSEHNRTPCNRNGSNSAIVFVRSPSHQMPVEPKSNSHAPHLRTTSSEENISSSRNHYQTDDGLALSLSNRMKRPLRFSPHSPSKLYRRSHASRRSDSNFSSENTSSYSNDEFENGRTRPSVCLNNVNINAITTASTLQPINNSNNDTTNDIQHHHNHHHHDHYHYNNNTNNNNSSNNTHNNCNDTDSNNEQNEQKPFKIRIKREFKIESNDMNKSNIENIVNESVVVDTKAHLRPLIANIKQE